MAMKIKIPTRLRLFIDYVIDFIFGLFWERKHTPIPDVDKKYAFLSGSATSLAKKIKQKELTSEELVQAVINRIKQVNPYLNAITADRFDEALEEAKEIDRQLALGLCDELVEKPFLGVPYTTKESQAIKGMPLTMGLWRRRNERATEDSEAVELMRNAGAIPVACTNIPELLLWQETRNPVYGMTNNPHHTGRSPGGSSGGEAALVASHATVISLCSDIGGSTRIPAFYCGMFGYHPTPGATKTRGSFFRNGNEDSMFSLGFIARHVADLAPLTTVIAGDNAYLLKFDKQAQMKDIKFYYLDHSNDPRISPLRQEMRDTMQRVINKISKEFNVTPRPYYHKGIDHVYQLWSYWVSKEPGVRSKTKYRRDKPARIRLAELTKMVTGRSKQSLFTILKTLELLVCGKPQEEWAENLTKSLKEDLFSKLGTNGVLLLPSAPHAAPYHYSCLLRPYNVAYWMLVNVLKTPAMQVPVGTNARDLPLGLQVTAAPYSDALLLTVAAYLEQHFGGATPACKVNT